MKLVNISLQGDAVETKQCGSPVSGTWDCMYGIGNTRIGVFPADRPEVKVEIGPGCRCGCIVHLSVSKPKRLIASSAESCPGRSFWLIQVSLIPKTYIDIYIILIY